MGALFNFNTLITPRVMKLLFAVGVVASGLTALVLASAGLSFAHSFGGAFLSLLTIIFAIATFFIGVIASRVSCECILVMFMIRSELAHLRQNFTAAPVNSNQ
jgi:hypothetical protein